MTALYVALFAVVLFGVVAFSIARLSKFDRPKLEVVALGAIGLDGAVIGFLILQNVGFIEWLGNTITAQFGLVS